MNTAPVVAVLGYPIHHSKSPKMHGYWLDQAGVSGYYVPLEIHPDNFFPQQFDIPDEFIVVRELGYVPEAQNLQLKV